VVGDTNMLMINLSIINKCADRNTWHQFNL
jgi:hypothetical protein